MQEKINISWLQVALMVVGFTLGSSLLFPPGSGVNQQNWLAIILGMVEGSLFASIYLTLAIRFPGKTLIEIDDLVWGPYFGKLVSGAYLFYLFHFASVASAVGINFIKFAFLPFTPMVVIVLLMISLCIVAASSGVEAMARSITILVIAAIAASFFVDAMLLPQFRLENLQPVLEAPWLKLLAAGHRAATFPFGDSVVFLMIIPFLNTPQKARSSIISGILFAGLVLVIANIRDIGVLGGTMAYFLYPSYSAARLINVGEIFTRIEVLIGISFITTNFIRITIVTYSFMMGAAQMCRLKSYRTLAIPVWLLLSFLAMHNYHNVIDSQEFSRKIYPIYALPFQVGIPLFTLIMAIIRKLPRESS